MWKRGKVVESVLMIDKREVFDKLKKVIDPELGVDIVSLGFIYNVDIKKKGNGYQVDILMTLTTPGCPLIDTIEKDVKKELSAIDGIKPENVNVKLTFDPPWTTDMMTEDARLELGFV